MNPEKQKLLNETYNKFMELMLGDLPLDSVNDLAVDDVTGYGSTVDEKITDINRLRQLVIDQREQGAGVDISVDTKPVHRRISPEGDAAIFIDEIEITIKTGTEKNVLNLRLSIIFEFINERWKVVHMHGSTGVETEDDTWHLDEWKKKMEELQKLVDEKTADLQNKNRELEIEASLERVRAVAMSMNKPDDLLNICEILFSEFKSLGFKELRNAMINIHNDEKKSFLDYDYSDVMGKSVTHLNYDTHPVMEKQIKQSGIKNDAFSEAIYKGKDLDEWKKFRKESGEKDDPRIENIEALYYYFYSIGNGTIGISTFSPIGEEKLTLLKRFRNVFSLAYQRYSDIALAEAQAREAQIEAALERVRARSMGMHKSDELKNVVRILYKEFRILVTEIDSVNIQLNPDSSKDIHFWTSVEEDIYPELYHLPYVDLPIFENVFNAFNSPGEGFFDYLLNKEEKDAFFREIFKVQPVPPQRKKMIQNAEGMVMVGWFHKHSGIDIVHYNLKRFSEEEKNIVKRFAAAFEQTYIRFLDLQKAEEQARESEIQLALERVRARTMAMHQSDELAETAAIVFQQMTELGVSPERINICLIKEAENVLEVWATDQQGIKISHHFNASLDEPTTGKPIYDAWKDQKKSIVIDLSGKELNDWIRYVREVMGMTIKDELVKEHRIQSVAFFSQGMILTTTPEPLPEESIKLLERFADVFNLTYRRFLDLQKAEAQAREAQIESALERVRSKAMSMQKSDDLSQAVKIIFDELDKLNLGMLRCGIGILNKENRTADVWTTTISEGKNTVQVSGDESMDINPLLQGAFNAWLNQEDFSYVIEGEELNNYYKSLLNVNFRLPESQSKISGNEGLRQYYYVATFQAGGLFAFRETEFPEESKKVIKRFADVFNLTYTRFNDLLQAEAQNKIISAENERKTKELEEARELQLAMLPKEIPQFTRP